LKKIIWVTGAAGFLGFNTVKQLALSGFKVVGFDTRTLDFKYDNILDFYFINAPSSYNVLENTEKKFGIPMR
jgi:nucleoside-diphosphate-sugar epimerase